MDFIIAESLIPNDGAICVRKKMSKEDDYVDYFYEKHQGRVAIGVGYNQDISEIYPLVFQSSDGESIGIIALGVIENEPKVVHIYHLGAFVSRCGNGSRILKALCHQADNFNIYLSVTAVVMPNGKNPQMADKRLVQWYKSFGFKGDTGLLREPVLQVSPYRAGGGERAVNPLDLNAL